MRHIHKNEEQENKLARNRDSKKIPQRWWEKAGKLWIDAGLTIRRTDRQKWLSIILLFLVLEIPVLSIERAKWITPQPWLTLVLVLSMIVTWLLISKWRINVIVRHAAVIVTGGLVTLWQVLSVPSFGQATIYFAIFLVFLVWLVGYIATWYYIRKQNAWAAVMLGAVVILVNLSNLPDNFFYFFTGYFLIAIVFIVRNRISRHDFQAVNDAGTQKRGMRHFIAGVTIVSVIAVAIAWAMPVARAPSLENWVAKNTLWSKNIEKSSFNFFAYVMAKQPRATSTARRYLRLGSYWHENDNIHFIVESERPAYWQVYVYDEYTSQGWLNSPLNVHEIDKDTEWERTEQYAKQDIITNKVESGLKTDMLVSAGEFIASDTPVFVHETDGEVIAVTTPRLLKPGETYEITSFISSATPEELSTAGENYPSFITKRYLQLPPEFPDSIRELSANITQDATTQYEKVMAIDEYLAGFPYEEHIEPPPEDVDGVEYFLTVQKSGFCTYFASAMAVMLRSVGVPSRLVVGYLPGEQSPDAGKYILRDRHYHAWSQVYFQGYGWINVEATPGSTISQAAAAETPQISSPIDAPSSGQMTTYQWWQMPYWLDYQVEPPSSGAAQVIHKDPQWPFADVLGKGLLVILISGLAAALIMSILLIFRSRFYRWLWKVVRDDPARNVYLRMCALGALVKMDPRPSQTPLEYASALAAEFPAQAEAFHVITQKYIDSYFGRKDRVLNLMEEAELLKMRREAYNTMLERLGFFGQVLRKPL